MFALLILPMMRLGAHYKMTLVYVNTDTILTARHLVSTNGTSLRKLSTSMFLQNTGLGQLTLKLVYQVGHSKWIHLMLLKDKQFKPVKKVEEINRVKFMLGFEMAVLPLPKIKMVHFFSDQLPLVLLKMKP